MTINPELRDLIPQLNSDELSALEASLKADGCINPIIVWHVKPEACDSEWVDDCKGTEFRLEPYRLTDADDASTEWHCTTCGNANTHADEVIVDGHHRYEICERLGINYGTHRVYFDSVADAEIWMINHQFGRRNLTPFIRSLLALKLEPLYAAKAKANQSLAGGDKALCQKSDKALSEPIDTKREVAKAAGVSHDTIAKAKVISKEADEQTKADLRSGKLKINTVYNQITGKSKPKQHTIVNPEVDADLEHPDESTREPGEDDSQIVERAPMTAKDTASVDRKIWTLHGQLIRACDDRARVIGSQGKHHAAALSHLGDFQETVKTWIRSGRA